MEKNGFDGSKKIQSLLESEVGWKLTLIPYNGSQRGWKLTSPRLHNCEHGFSHIGLRITK